MEERAKLSDAKGHGCKVLLVEDNELNRQTIADFLTNQGFLVTPVSSGQLALQQLERDVRRRCDR